MKNALIIGIIVLLLIAGLWIVLANTGGNSNTNTTSYNASITNNGNTPLGNTAVNDSNLSVNTNTNASANTNAVPALSVAIAIQDFSYTPSRIDAQPGQIVQVTLTNNGSYEHTFNIDELNVHSGLIAVGGTKTVSFTTPTTARTYTFFCSVDSHQDMGMQGTLTVAR